MELTSGDRLGPYEIVTLLGAGGMGQVYKAHDTRLDRAVAIKVIAGAFERSDAVVRFEREARAIAALNHPSICALYDVGEAPAPATPAGNYTVHFLVMEYVEGETLAARLRSQPLSTRDVVRIGRDLAAALAYAHGRGVLHRDIKPQNIMWLPDGRVKLLDFGIATIVESDADVAAAATVAPVTHAGAVVGTPEYMPPERLNGLPADARSDLFSLGAVLYELVTGRHPWRAGTQAATTAAILTKDCPPVASNGDAGRDALIRCLRRALAREPHERYQSATELHAVLDHIEREGDRAGASSRRIGGLIPWGVAAVLMAVLAAVPDLLA